MKTILTALTVLCVLAAGASANDERLNSVAVGVGAAIPLSANGLNQIAGTGGAFSIEYLRRVAPALDLGASLQGFGFADALLTSNIATAKVQTGASALSVLAHFHPWPDETVSPYLAGGIGLGGFSEKVDITPRPGFVWNDTRTAETRRTLDESSSGFAGQLGVGFEVTFSRRFFGAMEGDWHYITTDKNKFGMDSIQLVDIGAKVGWRF